MSGPIPDDTTMEIPPVIPSKRGRKRNDLLPPNRARDVQRAFRARRAAHLHALEQRLMVLEEENDQFRQLLNLPPSNRPPLGKGPTGKDKVTPREYGHAPLLTPLTSTSTSTSTSTPSPSPSPQTNSQSPPNLPATLSPGELQVIDDTAWERSLILSEQQDAAQMQRQQQQQQQQQQMSVSATYHRPPVLAPIPRGSPMSYPGYPSGSAPAGAYMSSTPGLYRPNDAERGMQQYGGYNGSPYLRDDPSYGFPQQTYQNPQDSPPMGHMHMQQQRQQQQEQTREPQGIPFPHRRTMNGGEPPMDYRPLASHYPRLASSTPSSRGPDVGGASSRSYDEHVDTCNSY